MMRKIRHEKDFIHGILERKFYWIQRVSIRKNSVPGSKAMYDIEFTSPLKDFEYRYNREKSERKVFEEFVFDFYEVKKRKHQVICCWRNKGATVVVF